jgi:DNA polymerase elongation subunit (family B)
MLIGRGEDKKRLKFRVQQFPYFYVRDRDYKFLDKFLGTLDIEEITHGCARDIMKQPLTKITVQDADRVSDNIHMVNKYSKSVGWSQKHFPDRQIYTYEADLSRKDLLPLRWMIDHGIKCGIDIQRLYDGTKFQPLEDFSVPLRTWLLDFEAYSNRTSSSGLNLDEPLIMVSIWDTYEQTMYTYYVDNPKWTELQRLEITAHCDAMVNNSNFKQVIKGFKTEASFLDGLMELSKEKDPDLIVAWNLNRYDLPKWKQRCDQNVDNCIYSFKDLSPLHSLVWHTRQHRVKGRVLFDLMVAFKQYTDAEMDSYSLAYVTESEKLGVDKEPFIGTSAQTWDLHPEIMFKRNVKDVLIMKALDEKYGLIDTYDELRKEFGCLFHESFVPYRTIDTALMRMIHGRTVLLTAGYGHEESKLLGAIIIKPEIGDYENIVQLDISRGYPTHIQGFNIGPETYRETEPKESHYTIEYDAPSGKQTFYFVKSPTSLLSQLITFFNRLRTHYQEEMQKAIERHAPESEIKKWERRQYNVKKKTNAIYGVMDFLKFRLHRKECTQATAIIGRIIIEELARFLETIGYHMLYGDTDSTFIKLKTAGPEECQKEGAELCRLCNDHLDKFFKEKFGVTTHAGLGFKAIYSKIKFFKKKNYAGKYLWEEKKGWNVGPDPYEFKGIASVRSDSSVVEKTALKTALKMALDGKSIEEVEAYKDKVIEDFEARKFTPMEIAYPLQIKKRLTKTETGWETAYESTVPAHVKAAIYTNIYLNTDFREGDKPRRLPVKFPREIKFYKGQQMLFVTDNITYPTEWEFDGKIRKTTDISIVEDMVIPQFFLDHIDYDRIEKRLKGKLAMVNRIDNPEPATSNRQLT